MIANVRRLSCSAAMGRRSLARGAHAPSPPWYRSRAVRGRRCRLAAVLCLAWSAGCTPDDHEIIANVRTDLVPGVEFVGVRTSVDTADGTRTVDRLASRGEPFIDGVRVAEVRGTGAGTRNVFVSLLD